MTINKENETDKPFMLTTIDNPYNPFQDFVNWYVFDVMKGYNTSAYLARLISSFSDEVYTQKEERIITENFINYIVSTDSSNMYLKIYEDDLVVADSFVSDFLKEETKENNNK